MLVTNQLQYARPADKILYMADGRVVEAGTYDELMERGGGFAQLMQQTEVRPEPSTLSQFVSLGQCCSLDAQPTGSDI